MNVLQDRSPRPDTLTPPIFVALLLAVTPTAHAADGVGPSEEDPRKVMEAVEEAERGDKAKTRMQMTIIDKGGSKRVRVVQSQALDFDGGTKQIVFFESPADVRNTGLLTVDYDEGDKVDDQWLYLPALRKSTRISSSDKSGSFMGSDLSFADMTGQSPDHYDYKMLDAHANVGGEACWKIEAAPRTPKAKEETGYVRSQVWISKRMLLPIQARHWLREGKKQKIMKFATFKQVDGIWFGHKLSARTLQGQTTLSTTVLSFSAVSFGNSDVTDETFTQRRLEQGL